MRGCTSCAEFEGEGHRARFEEEARVSRFVPWDCTSPAHRALAIGAGVDDLPAYVYVPAYPDPIRVVEPSIP